MATKRSFLIFLVVMALAGVTAVSLAQSGAGYDLSWWTIDAGGSLNESGGTYSLSGTAGQPDASEASGSGYTLVGGFWGGANDVTVDDIITGLAASNNGPTSLGQPTTFSSSLTTGTGVSYLWNFGDGSSGSGPAPSHTYSAAGQFTAIVTASNLVSSKTATTLVEVVQNSLYLPFIIR